MFMYRKTIVKMSNLHKFFYGYGALPNQQSDPKFYKEMHVEIQRAKNSNKTQAIIQWYQDLLQSNKNYNNVVLAQIKKNCTMIQNSKPGNKPKNMWICRAAGEKSSLSNKWCWVPQIFIWKNMNFLLLPSICKNKFCLDCRSKILNIKQASRIQHRRSS